MFFKTELNNNISKLISLDTDMMKISRDSLSAKEVSLFDYYNIIQDNNWTGGELQLLISDIQNANTNQDGKYSRKEIRKFLKSIPMDSRMSVRKFNKFIKKLPLYSKQTILEESNGEIESFQQQLKPDCWLLADIKGLSLTSWGKQAIKESLTDNSDGTYTVSLKGVDFETVINKDDIDKAHKEYYSYGDLDVLLLELATERYFKQEVGKETMTREDDVLEGSCGAGTISMYHLLTGKNSFNFCLEKSKEKAIENTDKILEKANDADKFMYKDAQDYSVNTYSKETFEKLLHKLSENKEAMMSCLFNEYDEWFEKKSYNRKDKKSNDNVSGHAYIIKDIEKDENNNITNIVLINPWNSDI